MKTNKLMVIMLLVVAQILSSCASKEISSAQAQTNQQITMPAKPSLSADSMNVRLNRDANDKVLKAQEGITKDALSMIEETQNTIKSLNENKTKEAQSKLYELIGQMETLVAANPNLELIPVGANAHVNELITDINDIQAITEAAKTATKKGYYQEAKKLLDGLVSEEIISTYYLPFASYPEGLKLAAILTKEGKTEMAKVTILELLNTVVIEEVTIPLPVLKAEQYVLEAASLSSVDNKDEVLLLLDNADYQLRLAEALGYGKRNKDYGALAKSIKTLKKDITAKATKESIKKSFDSLKTQIKDFRTKFFSKAKKK